MEPPNKQIYLLWLLIITTMAKHIPSIEEDRKMHYHPAAMMEPPLDMEVVVDNGTTSYSESGEDRSWRSEEARLHKNNSTNGFDIEDDEDENDSVRMGNKHAAAEESNSVQRTISVLQKSERTNATRSLKKMFLSNKDIVCNDGTPAGLYLRKSTTGSPVWIVFLEGGWYCYDQQSCRNRWLKLRHLMTSSQWPDTREVSGILSPNPAENPYWHTANHVIIPYCSSDTWSGTTNFTEVPKDSFHFMGKLIVLQVIKDLIPLGLGNATQLIFAGSSAGGTGVMINLDPVQHLLHIDRGLKHIAVKGISDSGWFLDRTPFSPSILPPVDAIKKGFALWRGSLPKKCVDRYQHEPWRCYFGYRLYPTLRASLFVFQWLFDEAQMTADNVGTPVTPQQWDYIHQMGNALRESFHEVTAVFAPSCVSHSILTKREWLQVSIDDVSIAHALRCWELATTKKPMKNHPINMQIKGSKPAKKLVRSGGTHFKSIENSSLVLQIENDSARSRRLNQSKLPQNENRRRRRKKIDNKNNAGNSTTIKRERKKSKNKHDKNNSDPWGNSNNPNKNKSYPGFQETQNQRRKHHPNHQKGSSNKQIRRKGNPHNCLNLGRTSRRNQRYQPNRKLHLKCHDINGHNPRRHVHNKNKVSIKNFGQLVFQNNSSYGLVANAVIEESKSVDDVEIVSQPIEKQLRPQRSLMRGFKSVGLGCEHRHIERCSWPQCNHSCPRLLDPFTGEEVHFIDMLKSFGLEMESVAQALGVDMQTLNNMEHAELLNLLTQQSN